MTRLSKKNSPCALEPSPCYAATKFIALPMKYDNGQEEPSSIDIDEEKEDSESVVFDKARLHRPRQ